MTAQGKDAASTGTGGLDTVEGIELASRGVLGKRGSIFSCDFKGQKQDQSMSLKEVQNLYQYKLN